MYCCPYCNKSVEVKNLYEHVKLFHDSVKLLPATCKIEDCGRSFSNYNILRKHLTREHNDIINKSTASNKSSEIHKKPDDTEENLHGLINNANSNENSSKNVPEAGQGSQNCSITKYP